MKLDRIVELRIESGYRQHEIAGLLNMDLERYCQCEDGMFEFRIQQITKLSLLFNVSMDYLVGITDIRDRYKVKDGLIGYLK